MNRTERQLWNKVKGILPGVTDRVENAAITGFPDVYGDWETVSYWIELKVTNQTRAQKPLGCLNLLRSSQHVWCWRHTREGARVFLLVGHPKGLVMYRLFFTNRKVEIELIFLLEGNLTAEHKLYFISEMRKVLACQKST